MALNRPTLTFTTPARPDSDLPAGGGTSDPWIPVTLEAGSLLMDPKGIIDTASYGLVSAITFDSGDPGNMRGAAVNPDCPFWTWLIADPFDYAANAQVAIQVKIGTTPNDSYRISIGTFDGTDPPLRNDGIGGVIQCDDGKTGNQIVGDNPSFGNGSASIVSAGGMLSVVMLCNKDDTRMRYVMTRSTSGTGPAYGKQQTGSNPTSWTGNALHGYLAIGNDGSGGGATSGGTFAGIELRYAVLAAFD